MTFRLLQWSDGHERAANVQAALSAIDSATGVDATVNCGDMVFQYFEGGIANMRFGKSMCVIGNHDAILYSGTTGDKYDWTQQPTQAQLRTRYIQPLVTNFGVESPDGTTWWRKLIGNVMIVGLNDTLLGSTLVSAQKAWFSDTLDMCASNGYEVVVVKHGPSAYTTIERCNFSSRNATTKQNDEIAEYRGMYEGFDECVGLLVNTQAKVMCVLHGHDHYDAFGYITQASGRRVPVIGINSTQVDYWGDLGRSESKSDSNAVVINQIEIDNDLNTLRIYRLGASGSNLGCARKMLVWDYDKNAIVSVCSNRG